MTNRNTITVSFPENTKRIFIFSHTKLKFALAVSYYRLAEFILEEGLNIICLCNLFNPEIEWEERLGKNYMGFFFMIGSQRRLLCTIHIPKATQFC